MAKTIKMSKSAFVKEHKNLVSLLRTEGRNSPKLLKEAREQNQELLNINKTQNKKMKKVAQPGDLWKSVHKLKAKLGSGARFKSLTKKLIKKGAKSPGALAAWIGRKKYGKKRFAKLSAKGRKGKKMSMNKKEMEKEMD